MWKFFATEIFHIFYDAAIYLYPALICRFWEYLINYARSFKNGKQSLEFFIDHKMYSSPFIYGIFEFGLRMTNA